MKMKTIAILLVTLYVGSVTAQNNGTDNQTASQLGDDQFMYYSLPGIGGKVIIDNMQTHIYCGNNDMGTVEEFSNSKKPFTDFPWEFVNKDYKTQIYLYSKQQYSLQWMTKVFADMILNDGVFTFAPDENNNVTYHMQNREGTKIPEVSEMSFHLTSKCAESVKPSLLTFTDLRYAHTYAIVKIYQTSDKPVNLDSISASTVFSSSYGMYTPATEEEMDKDGDGVQMFSEIIDKLISKSTGQLHEKFSNLSALPARIAEEYKTTYGKYPQSYTPAK